MTACFTGFAALAFAFLNGCAVGPDYKTPTVATPPAYDDHANIWQVAQPNDTTPKGPWWEAYGDPYLNQLQTNVATGNQNFQAAAARLKQARALLDIDRARYFPHVSLNPSYVRQRISANRQIDNGGTGRAETFNAFTVPLDASYEVDLWGGVRRGVEAAQAQLDSGVAQLEAVRLAMQAEVASDYFMLLALDAELGLLRTNVDVFTKSLALTKDRRAGGIATDLDVARAETILKTTEALIPSVRRQRLQVEHAIALLTGQPAQGFAVPARTTALQPPLLPAQLPSALLQRRPDIAAAERQVAAANARIGVAQAAFYPHLTLNGTAGFESVSTSTLFDWPSHIWSLGPTVTVPLFQGGRLRAGYRYSAAVYEETVAQYRQTVLSAFAEVEDNLTAQDLLRQQHLAQQEAVTAAKKTLEIANNRYKAGLVTFLEVATAENDALTLEREQVRLSGERLITSVALVKSLGGDWRGLPDSGK